VYLLDTNVISELVRPRPDDRVVAWVTAAPALEIFISALTVGEVDGLLLATAQAHGLVFVTRNVAHCTDRGVTVIDPWAA
jgi:predicted nucleic acid-binding protein